MSETLKTSWLIMNIHCVKLSLVVYPTDPLSGDKTSRAQGNLKRNFLKNFVTK